MKEKHRKYTDEPVKYLPESISPRNPASKKHQERKAKFMARFYPVNGKVD